MCGSFQTTPGALCRVPPCFWREGSFGQPFRAGAGRKIAAMNILQGIALAAVGRAAVAVLVETSYTVCLSKLRLFPSFCCKLGRHHPIVMCEWRFGVAN